MKNLLIIYRQPDTAESVGKDLASEGYRVSLMNEALLDFRQFDPFIYDLVIIHLNLDVSRAWKIFSDFKKHFPYLPALLWIKDLNSLRYAVRQILLQKRRSGHSGYNSDPLSMNTEGQHLNLPYYDYSQDNSETYFYHNPRYLRWIQQFSKKQKTERSPFTL